MRILPDGVRGKSVTTRSASIHFCLGRPTAPRCACTAARSGASCAGTNAQDAAGALAEPLVGRRDDGALGDRRHLHERLFDLRRGEVQAAADDHVAQPIGDRQVAVLVEHAHVAGAIPAVAGDRARGQRRVRVAGEQVGPPRPDLAGPAGGEVAALLVDDPDLHALERMPVGAVALRLRLVGRRAGDRRVLRRAVGPEHLDPEPLRTLCDGGRDRRAPEADAPDELGVLRPERRVVQQAREEDGGAAAEADARLRHDFQRLGGLPAIREMDGIVSIDGHQVRGEEPRHVRERRGHERRASAARVDGRELPGLEQQRAVGVDDALGARRGARRVPDHRRPVRVDVGGSGEGRGVEQRVERDRAGQLGSPRPARDDDDVLEPGQPVADPAEILEVIDVSEAVHRDEQLRPGLLQDELDLAGSVEVHDRDHDGADAEARPDDRDRLRPVRELVGDDVADADAAAGEPRRHPQGLLVEAADRPRERVGVGPDPERQRRRRADLARDEARERVVGPVARRDVASPELRRNVS